MEAITELYIQQNYVWTSILHNPYIGGLKGDQTVHSEIEKNKANPRLSPDEQHELDQSRVNAAFEALNSIHKNN